MAGEFGLGSIGGNIFNSKIIGNSFQIDLDRLRKLVRSYIDNHQYQSALFWADKIVSFSNRSTEDVFWFAQCLFLTKQYHRAATCIRAQKLYQTDLSCAYLAARSHYAGKEYKEALEILDSIVDDENKAPNTSNSALNFSNESATSSCELQSSLLLLKGQVLEAMDNRGLAADCYREALQKDTFCYEAFYALVQHHMLSKDEEESLLRSLSIPKSHSKEEADLVKFLYEMQLKKYDKPSQLVVPAQLSMLQNNMDLATCLAERHYYNCDYQQCYRITSNVLNKDPFHTQCLPIHISCLVELRKSNALFYLAHKLVDLYPENAISWFAVGCYYLLIKKTDAARRYLSKATTLDRVFGPGWLVYGHSFAVENEHDQAMAAYFKASQLMKGCHLPLLYIGLEYGLTNNTKLAEKFFTQALAIAPEDPFVLHELGVVAFQSEDYTLAEKKFLGALDQVQNSGESVLPEKWEPLLNNLGHTSRKLKKYEEALEYHQHALVLLPQNSATYSAIGYVHALMEHWAEAVEYFHKALGFQRDDTFSTTMLGNAIEQLMNNMSPCDVPKELPLYTSSGVSNMGENKKSDNSTTALDTICEVASNITMEMETDTSTNDLHTDPDYSCAYVIIYAGSSHKGHGFTFTIGRGTEIVVEAIKALSPILVGKDISKIFENFSEIYRELTSETQLRWLGPEKGVIQMASAALLNALWDMYAKKEKKPLWRLLVEMEPEKLVSIIDFRYIEDVLTKEEALEILKQRSKGKEEREEEMMKNGYPAYTTQIGWLGYEDAKLRKLCKQFLAEGFTMFKAKVGADLADDKRRLKIIREEIGWKNTLMVDANQRWGVQEAIDWMTELKDFKPLWIEEPTSPDDILGHATIAKAMKPYGIGVASGEQCQNRIMFKQFLQAKALSFVQIDSCRLGSLNEIVAVYLMAAKFGVPVCPHAGGVGLCELVQHLAIWDYICVSGTLENRVTEFVDHLHEHFLYPVEIKKARYMPPKFPGYSTQIKELSLSEYQFPKGRIWVNLRRNGVMKNSLPGPEPEWVDNVWEIPELTGITTSYYY